MTLLVSEEARDTSSRLLPRFAIKRDRILPIIIASLVLHALVLAPLLWRDAPPRGAQEIPVELVQLPPEPPKVEKKEAEKPPQQPPPQHKQAPKPPEQQKAPEPRKPAPKAEKPQPPKPPEPKKPETTAERMKDLLGPQSLDPIAMPGETADGTDLVSYGQIVMSRLTKALHRDPHPGADAYATINFVLGDSGEIVRESLTRVSGDPLLDEEALAVVKRAGPFPPPPPGGKRDYTVTLESRPLF